MSDVGSYPYDEREATGTDEEVRRLLDAAGIVVDEPAVIHQITDPNGDPRYACRYCIARFGYHNKNREGLPKTVEEHYQHLQEKHAIHIPA